MLSDAYQEALTSNAVDYVGLTDYGPYQPSAGVPTAWAVLPIGAKGTVEGCSPCNGPSTRSMT